MAFHKLKMNSKKVTRDTIPMGESFGTHYLMKGVNIREVQELLGQSNVPARMVYTHVLRTLGNKPESPLDML